VASITLVVGGKIIGTPEEKIIYNYQKRIRWPIKTLELKPGITKPEIAFEKAMQGILLWIALDEHGDNLNSVKFSTLIETCLEKHTNIGFVIGIDTGIPKNILDQCQYKISFGQMTWPHLLARVLLVEQLYRAQQIIIGHPYHKV
jgi:23S rRNA (pseudouridine1915-N3)-methyltransferase